MTEPDPLAKATMESVITSPAAVMAIKRINIKRKQPCPKEYCWVVSIDGISPKDIRVDQIQTFASQMGIKGCCHISKKKVFDAIADEKDNPAPKKEKKEEVKIAKNLVNWKRYFNVLFCDTQSIQSLL